MEASKFRGLFKDNYYLSDEYSNLFGELLGKPIQSVSIGKKCFYCIGGKLLGLHAFSAAEERKLKSLGLSFSSIVNEDNSTLKEPSVREYSVIPAGDYLVLYGNYSKHFRNQVNQAKRNNLVIRKSSKSGEDIKKAYSIYCSQVRRLSGFVLPIRWFEATIALKSASLRLVFCGKDIVSYAVTFENKTNVYLTLQGSSAEFFNLRPNNFVYDSIIKYCSGKNLHMGQGMHGTGFERFKEEAGAIHFKITANPDKSRLLNIGKDLWTSRIVKSAVGPISSRLGRTPLYKQYLAIAMPLT